jgi:hypothetical protein
MGVKALGNLFDIGTGVQTIADGWPGEYWFAVAHENYGVVAPCSMPMPFRWRLDTFVVDWQQHTAASAVYESADLDVITEWWYIKSEATLDNDEVWTRVTQSVASEIANWRHL